MQFLPTLLVAALATLSSSPVVGFPLPRGLVPAGTNMLAVQRQQQRSPAVRLYKKVPRQQQQTKRTLPPPYFDPSITSCNVCSNDYASMDSCMMAAPVFANPAKILFNPSAFMDTIKCACTETFEAVFPQCVDCFEKTGQPQYLGTDPAHTGAGDIITGFREVCGLAAAILGGVATKNGDAYSTSSTIAAPVPMTSAATSAPVADATPTVVNSTPVAAAVAASASSSSTSGADSVTSRTPARTAVVAGAVVLSVVLGVGWC